MTDFANLAGVLIPTCALAVLLAEKFYGRGAKDSSFVTRAEMQEEINRAVRETDFVTRDHLDGRLDKYVLSSMLGVELSSVRDRMQRMEESQVRVEKMINRILQYFTFQAGNRTPVEREEEK